MVYLDLYLAHYSHHRRLVNCIQLQEKEVEIDCNIGRVDVNQADQVTQPP